VMQRRAFELQLASDAELEEPQQVDLGRIVSPALVVSGGRDHDDFHRIGRRLVSELPEARAATVESAGHLIAMECPEETARLVLEFLGD
jgi:3-oxoadipate enol-lactonase